MSGGWKMTSGAWNAACGADDPDAERSWPAAPGVPQAPAARLAASALRPSANRPRACPMPAKWPNAAPGRAGLPGPVPSEGGGAPRPRSCWPPRCAVRPPSVGLPSGGLPTVGLPTVGPTTVGLVAAGLVRVAGGRPGRAGRGAASAPEQPAAVGPGVLAAGVGGVRRGPGFGRVPRYLSGVASRGCPIVVTWFLVVSLGLEHPGNLPSYSRARRPESGLVAPRGSCSYALADTAGTAALSVAAVPVWPGVVRIPVLWPPPRPGLGAQAVPLAVRALLQQPGSAAGRPAGSSTCSPAGGAACDARWPERPARSRAPSNSAFMPSGPCASRVTSGGDEGVRAAILPSAARMSSGRTAGVTC